MDAFLHKNVRFLRSFFESDHIRRACRSAKTAAQAELLFHRRNRYYRGPERSENGNLFFFDLYLYGSRRACVAARAAATASLFVNIRKRALLILLDKEFAECAQHFSLFPPSSPREAYESRMISLPIPFGGRPPQLRLRAVLDKEFPLPHRISILFKSHNRVCCDCHLPLWTGDDRSVLLEIEPFILLQMDEDNSFSACLLVQEL